MCTPPEAEQIAGSQTDFETTEGGGFDDGPGTKNISNEVSAEDMVCKKINYLKDMFNSGFLILRI